MEGVEGWCGCDGGETLRGGLLAECAAWDGFGGWQSSLQEL